MSGFFAFVLNLLSKPAIFYLDQWQCKWSALPWKFQGKFQEIPHYLFLVTLENSSLFLINPWKFHMLVFWYPWKFHILNPAVCFFFLEQPIRRNCSSNVRLKPPKFWVQIKFIWFLELFISESAYPRPRRLASILQVKTLLGMILEKTKFSISMQLINP